MMGGSIYYATDIRVSSMEFTDLASFLECHSGYHTTKQVSEGDLVFVVRDENQIVLEIYPVKNSDNHKNINDFLREKYDHEDAKFYIYTTYIYRLLDLLLVI